jgi:hypothetical protein
MKLTQFDDLAFMDVTGFNLVATPEYANQLFRVLDADGEIIAVIVNITEDNYPDYMDEDFIFTGNGFALLADSGFGDFNNCIFWDAELDIMDVFLAECIDALKPC